MQPTEVQHRVERQLRLLTERADVTPLPITVHDRLGRSTGRCGVGSQLADVSAEGIRINAAAAADLSDDALNWTLAHELGHLATTSPIRQAIKGGLIALMYICVLGAMLCAVTGMAMVFTGGDLPPVLWIGPPIGVMASLGTLLVYMACRRGDELRADAWASAAVPSISGAYEATMYYQARLANTSPTWWWRTLSAPLASHPPPHQRVAAIRSHFATR